MTVRMHAIMIGAHSSKGLGARLHPSQNAWKTMTHVASYYDQVVRQNMSNPSNESR